MKKPNLIVLSAMLLLAVSCYDKEIEKINQRLDDIENVSIATLDQQVIAIKASIGNLEDVDDELQGYIDNLQTAAEALQSSIDATNENIERVEAELRTELETASDDLSAEIVSAKTELLESLEALRSDTQSKLDQINAAIAALQAADVALGQRIDALKTYTDTEIQGAKNWVAGTFSTLEQYSQTLAEIAGIKANINAINTSITELENRLNTKIARDIAQAVSTLEGELQQQATDITEAYTTAISQAKSEITSAYTSAIAAAIASSEVSMRSWVNERLAGYYTIAQIDAKLQQLAGEYAAADDALSAEIATLRTDLATARTELTSAYQTAIAEAITTNNGIINSKIAADIQTATNALQSQIDAINTRINGIEARVAALEADVAKLIGMVQSIVVMPDYSDGSVKISIEKDNHIRFEVYPLEVAAAIAEKGPSILSLDYVETNTKSPEEFHNLPILSVSFTGESLLLTVDGTFISDNVTSGKSSANARLKISDGIIAQSSSYFPLYSTLTAVDLGLSVKWANLNLGAKDLWEAGDFYAWGETEPYYTSLDPLVWKDGKEAGYDWTSYEWCNGSEESLIKYNTSISSGLSDYKTILDLSDDAAHVILGGKWRMPTKAEWNELILSSELTWTSKNGINGYMFQANGKDLFFPVAGVFTYLELQDGGNSGNYWASTLHVDDPTQADRVGMSIEGPPGVNTRVRRRGQLIRAVYDESDISMTLSQSSLSLNKGVSTTLTAMISPVSDSGRTISWTSTNTAVATVDQNGKVTAVDEGTVAIIALCGRTSALCSVTVLASPIVADAVDLGLSVKWASWNLGASSPEEYGDYYAWGEIIPYYTEGHSQDNSCTSWQYRWNHPISGYNWTSYKWCKGGKNKLTKYCPSDKTSYWDGDGAPDNKIEFSDYDYADDAARAAWGSPWRMPTKAEFEELVDNCTRSSDSLNGVSGLSFTSKKEGYTDKSIFLPRAGHRAGTDFDGAGSVGPYWSSTLKTDNPSDAWHAQIIGSGAFSPGSGVRYSGHPVRPVCE